MESHNRRNFLKSGTLAGTTLLASTSFGAFSGEKLCSIQTENTVASKETKQRILGTGKHSIKVNYGLGLGCMGMSWHRTFIPDRKPMIALIRKAYDMDVNFFDTAEAYGPWRNEELVGEAIQSFRKNIIFCSKFGFNIQNGQLFELNSKPNTLERLSNNR